MQEFYIAQQKYNSLLDQKEAYWKQMAKQFWFSEGDSNTKFFHSMASARQLINRISRLKNDLEHRRIN